jgi:putative SOS response-associated peptidase YedK
MCNLYSMTASRGAVRQFARAMTNRTDNQPPLPSIFPDQLAPVVQTDREGRRIVDAMRWGFPPPPGIGSRPATNVRNTTSHFWLGTRARNSRQSH